MRHTLLTAVLLLSALPLGLQAQAPMTTAPITTAVASSHRSPANVARDRYRHPAETLALFGVAPGQTVVEFSPGGGGWYTEILAPLLAEQGQLIAAQPPGRYRDTLMAKLAANPAVYGKLRLVGFPPTAEEVPPGSADVVLTFRNVHNLVMDGSAAAAFASFHSMLKPGGILGVVDHRLPEDRDSADEKTSGYLKTSTVMKLAQDAGFELLASSEINANPKDTANWPQGVWTLPPSLKLGETDRDKYLAIGESDRMTLKFQRR